MVAVGKALAEDDPLAIEVIERGAEYLEMCIRDSVSPAVYRVNGISVKSVKQYAFYAAAVRGIAKSAVCLLAETA